MTVETLIVGGLAVWRLSHALVKEQGPRDWFIRLRARAATRQKRSGGLFDLLSCVYCISVWIGLVASLFVSTTFLNWIGYAFAFSGLAMLLEAFFSKQTDSLSIVTRPTANDKVLISTRTTPKQGNDVIRHPDSTYGSLAVKATTSLND